MRRRKTHPKRLGALTVEFAIVANLLFVVIFGCLELTRLSLIRSLAQDAAYFAARAAVVPGATETDATNEAKRILGTLGTRGVQVQINNGLGLSQSSTDLRCEVIIDLKQNMMMISMMPGWTEIHAVSTMKTERYNDVYKGG
jgi:Flp pilus assembly protein TadG